MLENPQFIYVIRPTRLQMLTGGPTQEEQTALTGHVNYLERMADEGNLILAGRTQTTDRGTFGIVIFNAESQDMAQGLMENDPAVKGGVMSAELYPYRVAVVGEIPGKDVLG